MNKDERHRTRVNIISRNRNLFRAIETYVTVMKYRSGASRQERKDAREKLIHYAVLAFYNAKRLDALPIRPGKLIEKLVRAWFNANQRNVRRVTVPASLNIRLGRPTSGGGSPVIVLGPR